MLQKICNRSFIIILQLMLLLTGISTQAQQLAFVKNWPNAYPLGGPVASHFIQADKTGNIYVAGNFTATVDFDPGPGRTDLTSEGSDNGFIAKYSSEGKLIFVKQLFALSGQSMRGMALDDTGNVFVTGTFSGTIRLDQENNAATFSSVLNGQDIYIASFNSAGSYRFGRHIGSPGYQNGEAFTITSNGELYLAGDFDSATDFDPGTDTFFLRTMGDHDIFLAKYSAYGDFLTAKAFGGTGIDGCRSISLDNQQNVFITGYFSTSCDFGQGNISGKLNSSGFFDIYFAKFDSSGNFIFAKQIGGANYESASQILTDSLGYIYLTGYFSGTTDFDPGAGTAYLVTSDRSSVNFFSKYDSGGNYLYAKALPGATTYIGLQQKQNLYVFGGFAGLVNFGTTALRSTNNSTDIFIARYDSNGIELDVKSMGGPKSESASALTFSNKGDVIVTGLLNGTVDF